MAGKLLAVDDDRFILNSLVKLLGREGYHVTTAVSGTEAQRLLEGEAFDLLLLDVSLGDVDGVTLCRRIRARHRVPIIMLTGRDAIADKVVGLEVGADDYITKPFDPPELLARVRAQLRRSQEYNEPAQQSDKIVVGPLVVDPGVRDALFYNRPAGLTQKEFELLHLLARHQGRALARDWLFEQVWGYDAELGVKTLAVYIRRLRCKIEDDPDNPCLLRTVRGFGYQLVAPEGDAGR
jgi:DNA-binding response OmpR family regulator